MSNCTAIDSGRNRSPAKQLTKATFLYFRGIGRNWVSSNPHWVASQPEGGVAKSDRNRSKFRAAAEFNRAIAPTFSAISPRP